MKTLLHIDSSPRRKRSHSRNLTKFFREHWLKKFSEFTLKYRDLYHTKPSHVDQPWIESAFKPANQRSIEQEQAIEQSDYLVDELLEADAILLGVPMYNFGMPSILKAYVDNIIRINRTFSFDPNKPNPYKPMVADKKMFVIVATGDNGYEKGGPLKDMNHLEPHIRTAFGFIGIESLTFVYAGNDEFGGEKLANTLDKARHEIRNIAGPAGSSLKKLGVGARKPIPI